jgi:ELWxxDGT repeat protein
VKNIYPGSSNADPCGQISLGTRLFFQANDGVDGAELWKTDGTGSGTKQVKDINSGPSSSFPLC